MLPAMPLLCYTAVLRQLVSVVSQTQIADTVCCSGDLSSEAGLGLLYLEQDGTPDV